MVLLDLCVPAWIVPGPFKTPAERARQAGKKSTLKSRHLKLGQEGYDMIMRLKLYQEKHWVRARQRWTVCAFVYTDWASLP